MSHLTVSIAAKINLHLEVLGRRPDGFHELRTLFQSVDLRDELSGTRTDDGTLELSAEPQAAVPVDGDNLVLKAAAALQRLTGTREGARLHLRKRIPVGGGLGGGSADAAGALVLLDRLWNTGQSTAVLHRLAADLGSDVPFFLHGGLALGVGRGQEVYPLPDGPQLGVVVAVPDLQVATAEVYGRLASRLTWKRPEDTVYAFAAGLTSGLPWEWLTNDLQPVVLEGWGQVAEALKQVRELDPLYAAVTGSGAAVFGLYSDRRQAAEAARTLGRRWWLHVGETVPRSQARLVATASM